MSMNHPHIGSSLNEFLKGEGILEHTQNQAIKEVIAWQLAQAMKAQSIAKSPMAKMLNTSRSQIDRLLDPTPDVTLHSLQNAAALLGKTLRLDLV